MISKKDNAIKLLEEVLENLHNPKYNLFNAIQKLNRIGKLLQEKNLIIWTEIQLGNLTYTNPLKDWIKSYFKNEEEKTEESKQELEKAGLLLEKLGIVIGELVTNEELNVKWIKSGGEFANIGFIEERYNQIVKTKIGNDGAYYVSSLANTLSTIKTIAYKKASFLHKKYAYEILPESNFELLKRNVDDKLLDIAPELAEMLMLAFKSVSSEKPEEWSHALTSCRRFFQRLADNLYPATKDVINGKILSNENYINRLWAFLDKSIESKSNKEIAKSHIDFIGSYLQSLNTITSKGVHAELSRFEALKTVFHVYLLCADLLENLNKKQFLKIKPNIHTATLDELEIIGKVNRNIAKEIIKLRVHNASISEKELSKISGLGEKSLRNLLENISFDLI